MLRRFLMLAALLLCAGISRADDTEDIGPLPVMSPQVLAQIIVITPATVFDFQGLANSPGNPPAGKGRVYFNSSTSQLTCITSTGASCSGGASSVTSANSGLSGPQAIYPNAAPFNINFDAQSCMGTHVAWTNGANSTVTIDSTCAPFTVGKTIKGFGTNCNSALTCYAGAGGSVTLPMGTLTPTSTTTATSSATATAGSTSSAQFWYGSDQRSVWCCGAGTVDNSLQSATGCVDIRIPAGGSFIPTNLFNTVNVRCGLVTVGNNESSALDAGNTIHGAGFSASKLIVPPDDSFNCSGFAVANVCLMAGMMGGGDFVITGGGNCNIGATAGTILWEPTNVSASTWWQNVGLQELGCTDNNAVGAALGFSNKYDGIYSDAFGSSNQIGVGGNNTFCLHCYFGETKNQPLVMTNGSATQVRIEDTYIGATQSTIGIDANAGAGSILSIVMSQDYGAVAAGGTQIFVRTGNTVNLDKWYENQSSSYDVELQAGGILHYRNSKFTAATHNIGTNGVTLTTGTVFDEGGNTKTSNNDESTVVPTCAESAGNGTCAVTTGSTNERGVVRITAGTTTSTNPSFTMTFAGTFAGPSGSSPSCTFQLSQTGSGSWVTAAPASTGLPMITASSTTAQTVGITTTVNAVSTSTYDVRYNCVPQ